MLTGGIVRFTLYYSVFYTMLHSAFYTIQAYFWHSVFYTMLQRKWGNVSPHSVVIYEIFNLFWIPFLLDRLKTQISFPSPLFPWITLRPNLCVFVSGLWLLVLSFCSSSPCTYSCFCLFLSSYRFSFALDNHTTLKEISVKTIL